MLSLWLDSSAESIEEMLPSAHQKPVCSSVKQLISTLQELQHSLPIHRHDAMLDEHSLCSLFRMGLFSLTVPKENEGIDASLRDFVLVMEAVGELGAAWAMTAVPHLCISVKAVARFATSTQRNRILKDIRQCHHLLAFAITEEQGSDVAAMRTKLKQLEHGRFVLNGRKQWITNLKRASHVVVACLCPDLHSAPGASVLVLVNLQQRGVTIGRSWDKVCVNGSDTSELYFDDVEIDVDSILTKPGQGMNAFLEMVQAGRLATAATTIGLARRAVQQTVDHTQILSLPLCDQLHLTELNAQLNALSAALRMCAVFGDEKHYDFAHLVSLMKFICGSMAQDIVQQIDHLYAKHKQPLPRIASNIREALGLFCLLKGPGEILAWQTVLAWGAILLDEMKIKPNWPSALYQSAQYLNQEILNMRKLGGPQQRPDSVRSIAEGLAHWWLELSCQYLESDAASNLSTQEVAQAQSWAKKATQAWQKTHVHQTVSLQSFEIETLYARLNLNREHLFHLRLEQVS